MHVVRRLCHTISLLGTTFPRLRLVHDPARACACNLRAMTIPCEINVRRNPDLKSPNTIFDDGVIEKTVGALKGGLVHIVFRAKGPEATRTLFTSLQMVDYWRHSNW